MSAVARINVSNANRYAFDDLYIVTLNDNGWRVRLGYRIDKVGTAPREYMTRDGLQRDEGEATEVTIKKAWLLNHDGKCEVPLELRMFKTDDLIDWETEIAQQLDEG